MRERAQTHQAHSSWSSPVWKYVRCARAPKYQISGNLTQSPQDQAKLEESMWSFPRVGANRITAGVSRASINCAKRPKGDIRERSLSARREKSRAELRASEAY